MARPRETVRRRLHFSPASPALYKYLQKPKRRNGAVPPSRSAPRLYLYPRTTNLHFFLDLMHVLLPLTRHASQRR